MSEFTDLFRPGVVRNVLATLLVAFVTAGCNEDAGVAENRPPVLSGLPAEVSLVAGESLQVKPWADDADGDSLTFEIDNQPIWTSFDSHSGALSGTPTNGDAGTYDGIRISVSDGKGVTMGPAFRVVVTAQAPAPEPPPAADPPPADDPPPANDPPPPATPPPNGPPQITGSPATSVVQGQAYSFQPSASDPDGQSLTFSIVNKPVWAGFNSGTGRLSGTPSATDVGVNIGIVISVSDGLATASLPSFEIVVEAANRAPSIGGTPVLSIVESQAYSFTPTASDPDGDALSFRVSNKPSWANFNASTGQLSGTPGAGTVGSYPNIVITVSDGQAATSLPAFTITVQQAATGSATLSWAPPTTRTDGTPLTDLAGYKIHYGTSQGSYPNKITIDNPGITTYVIEDLAPATYYFVTTAFDATGGESDYSNVASKTIK